MNTKINLIDVIVPLAVPNKFTYSVPDDFVSQIEIGKRVIVPFGKSKYYTAIVYQTHQQLPEAYQPKAIEGIMDEKPIVNTFQLQFWDWVAQYYMCNIGDVMNAALSSGLKLSSSSVIELNTEFNLEEMDFDFLNKTEHLIIDLLQKKTTCSFQDINKLLNRKNAMGIINKLIQKQVIQIQEEIKDKFKPKIVTYISLHSDLTINNTKLESTLKNLEKRAFKQAEVVLFMLHNTKINNNQAILKSLLVEKFDQSIIQTLLKKQILISQEIETSRLKLETSTQKKNNLSLAQTQALNQINEAFTKHQTVLLHGITGSGKTEIYIELIKQVLNKKKQILFLVPEIALTTQLINRLKAFFGNLIGVYHSKFSENEKVEIWNAILQTPKLLNDSSPYEIILGTRSSLYLPFHRLGLIIIDEEHDQSYKQTDPAPRYHARDAAIYLANVHQAKTLLGTATPSFESYYNTINNKFGLIELNERYGNAHLPSVSICDLKLGNASSQYKSIFTPNLLYAIKNALSKKEQVILFQNRRGYAPITQCNDCSWTPQCKNCDVSLIYHKLNHVLSCHYCGYSITPVTTCNACGSNQLRYQGLGTEKIEEDLEIIFPEAKIARMDYDSTKGKNTFKNLIDDFELHKIDILIGTQMVTKGLDFSNVSVVGVINADSIINFPSYKSHESAFQQLVQVSGRSGRKNQNGLVFIQTIQPQHVLFNDVINHSFKPFYENEIKYREENHYPPFSKLIEVVVLSSHAGEAIAIAEALSETLKQHFGANVLGPVTPYISRIKNKHYKNILLKLSKTTSHTKAKIFLQQSINSVYSYYKSPTLRININVDPV